MRSGASAMGMLTRLRFSYAAVPPALGRDAPCVTGGGRRRRRYPKTAVGACSPRTGRRGAACVLLG